MQREEQPQDSCEHGALSVISAPEHMRGKRAAAALQEQQQFHAPGIVELCTGSASSQEAAPHHNRPVMRSGSENERFYDFTSARNHLDNGKDKKQSDGVF